MGVDINSVATLTAPGGILSLDNGATNWMKVTAGGVLTRPQTPYMRGQISGPTSAYSGTPLLVVADVNRGNCWNNATGYFTCPVVGHYMLTMFSIAGGVGSAQCSGYVYSLVNGGNRRYTHWNINAGSTWHSVTLSCIYYCAVGDTLGWAVGGVSPAGAGVHGNGNHAMYSIALMA